MSTVHVPVLMAEVLEQLAPKPGDLLLDGTLGGGGHTRAIAERIEPEGRVLALDRDPLAVAHAETTLKGLPVAVAHASYIDAPELIAEAGFVPEDAPSHLAVLSGILLDLGLSSDQLETSDRGFSFNSTETLDLRFDPTEGEPAWRLIERLSAEHLANVIYKYGEERLSRRIARAIIKRRQEKPIKTADDLANIVRRAVPRNYETRLHPATRTFQALRIAVNDELGHVENALERLPALLAPGGRIAVISFHSLEDRLVKVAFRGDDRLRILTNKPIRPTEAEIAANPRSRSAKMRVAERIG